MNKNKYSLFTPIGLFGLIAIIGALLVSSNTYADDTAVDDVSINVPISCSLEGTGMNSHNASVVNGTYQADIGTTTMKAFCNDTNGFAIYAIGYTDDEYGKNVLTNSTLGSSANIATGTATSGNTSNWAMKLATDGTATYALTLDNSFNAYHNVPSTYTKVAHRDNATDIGTNATGSTLTTTYAAFMAQTQPAGTYTGQVKYTLVHPSDSLAPEVPIPIETAYAMAGKQKYNGYYKIQDMNSSICSNVNRYNDNGMAVVIDVRDNNTYRIAKLADDHCWMLDNLALDPTNSTTASNMNANNTNATAAAISNYLNGGSNTAGYSNVAVADVDTDFNSYTEPMINNASKDVLVTSFGSMSNNEQAKVGIYYNYCAATVGTYCYPAGSGGYSVIDQDICPAGWRMPEAGNSDEYFELGIILGLNWYNEDGVLYGDKALDYATSLSINLSGYYYNNIIRFRNSSGYWWSSSASPYFGRVLRVDYDNSYNSFDIYPDQGADRYIGATMRCIADYDLSD